MGHAVEEHRFRGTQWRLWNGSTWQPIGISGTGITAGNWYTLTIDGNIVSGQGAAPLNLPPAGSGRRRPAWAPA